MVDAATSGFDGHYYGVVRPVPGITFVSYGGWAYIGGKSAVGMQVGWFNNQRQATELVAHELSHNFSNAHAPCGAAAFPDPAFPYAGGVIGRTGYDLWSGQTLADVVMRHPQSPDIMGYCTTPWISDYHYGRILAARAPTVVADAVPAPMTSTLVLGGMVSPDSLRLAPVFAVQGRPSPPAPGAHVVEGFAGDGSLLFRVPFSGEQTDHGDPSVRYFTFVMALPESDVARLARVDLVSGGRRQSVRSGGGVSRLRLTAGADAAASAGVTLGAVSAAELEIAWDARQWPAILVRDPRTGALLAIGRGGRARVATRLRGVELVLSDGVRSATIRATRASP